MINRVDGYHNINAVMIIIAFASPLASIIRLAVLLYQYFSEDEVDFTTLASAAGTKTTFSGGLQAFTNSTVEKILGTIFAAHSPFHSITWGPKEGGMTCSSFADIVNSPTLKMHAVHNDLHVAIVVMVIGCLFLSTLILFVLVNMRQEALRYPGDLSGNDRKTRRMERKILRLLACLDDYKLELKREHMKMDIVSPSSTETKENEMRIIIPIPGESNTSESEKREVSDPCAICLSGFSVGQEVVWSSNKECVHVFHHDCWVNWVETRASNDCVCCRQFFVDKALYGNMKRKMKLQ